MGMSSEGNPTRPVPRFVRPTAHRRCLVAITMLVGVGCGPDDNPPRQFGPDADPLVQTLETWLSEHPRVAKAMAFDGAEGWNEWPNPWKDQLARDFVDFTRGHDITIQDPLVNHGKFSSNRDVGNPRTVSEYRNADVWRLYVNLVAYSLKMELHDELPWTVTDYSKRSLQVLFSGSEIFNKGTEVYPYVIPFEHFDRPDSYTTTSALPTTAARAKAFVEDNDILADTPVETVGNVLDWARTHLIHHSRQADLNETTWDVYLSHWGYDGPAPVLRTLDGWAHPGRLAGQVRHYTAGCHGTTSVLQSVLRAVNIPVTRANRMRYAVGGHSLTRFPSIGMNLSHGDDPYGTRSTTQPWPITELLIDDETFESWFFPKNADNAENVSRQARIILRKYR